MSEELRAAAERVLDNSYTQVGCLFRDGEWHGGSVDAVKLAKHILTSHPPDGETLIDEEWLSKVAPAYWKIGREYYWPGSPLRYECKLDGRDRHGFYLRLEYGNPCHLRHITTRQHLRDLCRLLGVSLKE